MSTPTISTVGATDGLLLIADHEGVISRVPKASVATITNSSNSSVSRLEVSHAAGNIVLIFANATEVTTFLSAIDSQY